MALTIWLYLARRYVTVPGNNVHVYLSLQALQLKPMSVKMRLTSVTNVFFWTQLLWGAGKKSHAASLKGLVGIELEGLEIEWTNRALSCYLWLNRAPAGCSPQQNAALGCMKGAQTTAHPLSGFDLDSGWGRSSGLGPGWFCSARTSRRETGSGKGPALLCSLRRPLALQSLSCHWHQMKPPCWRLQMTDHLHQIKLVLRRDLTAKGEHHWRLSGPSGDATAEAPLSNGWHDGLLCSPRRTSLVNDSN